MSEPKDILLEQEGLLSKPASTFQQRGRMDQARRSRC